MAINQYPIRCELLKAKVDNIVVVYRINYDGYVVSDLSLIKALYCYAPSHRVVLTTYPSKLMRQSTVLDHTNSDR